MNLNQQTKLFYDKEHNKQHRILSERPLQYYTFQNSQNRFLKNTSLESIIDSNNLRFTPTRLNENERDNIMLHGTAPFKGLHDGPKVIENQLIYGEPSKNKYCDKGLLNDYAYFENNVLHPNLFAGVPLVVEETHRNGISTRSDYRNACFYTK